MFSAGLNLLEVLNQLRDVEDEPLQLQCDVYYEEEHEDNEQLADEVKQKHTQARVKDCCLKAFSHQGFLRRCACCVGQRAMLLYN